MEYYDMNPHGRKTTKKSSAGREQPFRELGIGTRTCFPAFRPPRTITTSDMSVEELSNSQPSDEKGLLQVSEQASIVRTWTTSSADTTENLTSVQSSLMSSPGGTITTERGGYTSSGGDSLLSMPAPTNRSHQKRLQLERGRGKVLKYDEEQEPAGYRGQEAFTSAPSTPSPRAQPNNLLAMPASKDRSSRRRREGKINMYSGELDPLGYGGKEPASPPESQASQGSLNILAMPTSRDHSHIRRLQLEREGMSNAYEAEQAPAGHRGQEAITPEAVSSQISLDLRAMRTPEDRSHVRQLQMEREGKFEYSEEEQEPPIVYTRQISTIAGKTSPRGGGELMNLLALPKPTDRSHRGRKQAEREGRGNIYAGEQQPMRYRGGHSVQSSPELVFRTPIRTDRMRQDPSGELGIAEDLNASFNRDDSPTKGTGSPYLQFSPAGPALRVFETSPKQMISPNSSMMDTSVESDDQIRLMVKDLVPLSASAEKKIKNRVAGYTKPQDKHQATNIQPIPILETPTRRRNDYSIANTQENLNRSASGQLPLAVRSGKLDFDTPFELTPERSALAVIRASPSGGEISMSSTSTCSSVTLRNMMNDLVDDNGTTTSCRSAVVTDVNKMAASAQSHVEDGEYDLALVLFGRILSIYKKKYGNAHPLVASAYHNLGIVHSQRGSLLLEGTLQQRHVRQQSLQCFQSAARTARDSLGKNHANVAVSLVKIGFLLLQARQYEPALVTFEEALRIRLVAYGTSPNQLTANLHNNLGICLLHLQRFIESKQNLHKALEIQRHMLRVERRMCTREDLRVRLLEVADTLSNLGGLGLEWLRQEGPHQNIMREAESQLAEAMEIRSTVLGYNHPLALQVKSLHDMVRSTPSRIRKTSNPSSIQSPFSAREQINEITRTVDQDYNYSFSPSLNDSSNTPIDAPVNTSIDAPAPTYFALTPSPAEKVPNRLKDAPAPQISKTTYASQQGVNSFSSESPRRTSLPTLSGASLSKIFALPPSPEKAQNSSRDAPAPKAFSPSPVVEMLGQRKRTDISVNSVSLSRVRVISSVPPVSEILVGDEEDKFQNRRKSPERIKIFVSPHYVPRKSPSRDTSAVNESYYSDPKAPVLVSSSESESWQSHNCAYDTEESCLINESGDRVDLLSRFLVQAGETDTDEMNISSHEIMIVRPSATSAIAPNTPGSLVHPLAQTIKGPWKGDSRQNKSLTTGDESDDGIAPLCRSDNNKIVQKVQLSEDMLENPEPHVADIHAAASRYLKKNRLIEAKHLFITVLDCQRKAHGELHEDVGGALHNVGLVHLRANEYGESLAYFERAVRVRKGSLGREHPEVAVSQVKVGITLLLMHSFDLALQAFLDALSIRKRALGDLHSSNAAIYCNIGCVHVEFNELRDARRAFEAALDIQRNALYHEPDSGPLMFGTATTLCNLGYLYRYREMHQKVVMVLKEALSLQEGVLGKTHPTVVTTMDSLADALSMSGGCSQALRYYNEILSRIKYVVDISNRRQAEAVILYKMSRAHRKQNDVEAEVDKLKKALQAVRGTGVSTPSEKKRKEQLERHILADICSSRDELEKMQLEWI